MFAKGQIVHGKVLGKFLVVSVKASQFGGHVVRVRQVHPETGEVAKTKMNFHSSMFRESN